MQEPISIPMRTDQALAGSGSSTLPALKEPATSSSRTSAPDRPVREYVELKLSLKELGLLERQPIYYTYKFLSTFGLLAVGLIFLVTVHNFWLQLLDAVYLAFVCGQIGYLGHDIGHRQVFRSTRNTTIGSFLV